MVGKLDKDGNLKWGFINAAGQVVIPPEYDWVDSFSEGLAVVGKLDGGEDGDWRFGFVDATGRKVVPLAYDDARVLSGGRLCAVEKDGAWGVFLVSTPEDGGPWRTVWLAVAAIGAAFVAAAARGLWLTRKSRRPAPEQAGERGRHPG